MKFKNNSSDSADTATVPEPKEYVEKLELDLKQAERELNELSQQATKAQSEYNTIHGYCEDLEDYLDEIETTYNQVVDLEDFIKSLTSQAENLCAKVDETNGFIKMIAEAFKCLYEDTEVLKQMVKDLQDAILKLGEPTLTADSTLVKCISDLQSQMDITLTSHKTTMKSLVELWGVALELGYMICGEGESDKKWGLAYALKQLNDILCCNYCAGIPSTDNELPTCAEYEDGEDQANITLPDNCCNEPGEGLSFDTATCNMPKPALCADTDNAGFNSTFFTDLETEKEKVCATAEYRKCLWLNYEKMKQKAATKHSAIKMALDAAKAAKALCK